MFCLFSVAKMSTGLRTHLFFMKWENVGSHSIHESHTRLPNGKCLAAILCSSDSIFVQHHQSYRVQHAHGGGEVGYITPAIYSYVVAYGVNQLYYLWDFRTVPEITWCWSMVLFVFCRASNKWQQWQICQRQQLGDNGMSARARFDCADL